MKSLKEASPKYQKKDYSYYLKQSYIEALNNPEFKKLINTLKLKEALALRYTTKLEETSFELQNCKNCKGLNECRNKVEGFVYYPKLKENDLFFDYIACKFQKEELKVQENINTSFFNIPEQIKKAKMADIDATDAKRVKIIKWLTKFYKEYQKNHQIKGLYLHGSFGSGKSYLISALLNELSKDNNKVIIIYYPELLRNLKEAFDTNDFAERINEIEKADLLLLDDIGAETVTGWNRDEILGTILQYRMENKLPTFFTSNLNIKELEEHLTTGKAGSEQVKARRIIERINQLADNLELISENRRK